MNYKYLQDQVMEDYESFIIKELSIRILNLLYKKKFINYYILKKSYIHQNEQFKEKIIL